MFSCDDGFDWTIPSLIYFRMLSLFLLHSFFCYLELCRAVLEYLIECWNTLSSGVEEMRRKVRKGCMATK